MSGTRPEPTPEVCRLKPYGVNAAGRRGLLRLDFNENTMGPSPVVLQRLAALDAETVMTYPDETAAREAVARHFALASLGSGLSHVLTSGVDEGIRLVCDTFVRPGERVVILEPGYAMYRFYATLAGADVCGVDVGEDVSFPEDGVREQLASGCRAVILGDPHNPTGTAVPEGLVAELAGRNPSTVFLVDEAYAEFAGRTSLGLLPHFANVVVARTFSKAYGLAGVRAGVLMGDAETLAWMERMRSPYAVNAVALAAIEAALSDPAWAELYVKEVRIARDDLTAGLDRLGIRCFPSEANFLIARFGESAVAVKEALEKRGILVRQRAGHPVLEGTLRIGVGTQANVQRLLDALGEILAQPGDSKGE